MSLRAQKHHNTELRGRVERDNLAGMDDGSGVSGLGFQLRLTCWSRCWCFLERELMDVAFALALAVCNSNE